MSRDNCSSDHGFLNEERTSKKLGVLQGDQQRKAPEYNTISKLHNAKRDIKWLQGATGEWFEEIQRKKFRNDTDVSSILKQPLTHRLKKTGKNDSTELKMSRSKSQQPPSNTTSSPSILGLRSPLASLLSFRNLRRQGLKKPPPQPRNVFPAMGNHISARIEEQTKQTETYSSRMQNKHLGHPFSAKEDRTGVGNAPPADSQLESELFLVLGDLERKLGQEQTESCMDTGAPSYASQGQFRNEYSTERGHSNIFADRTNYSDNSRTSFPDGTRTLTPSDEYKTHSTFRPKRFYEMYSNRHRTAPKHSYFQRQTSHEGPPVSSVPGGRSLNSSATFGNFSVRSLHLPSLRHSSFGFLQRGTQKESKRTPISSISWNTPLPNSHVENSANIYKAQSLMDLSNVKQDLQPTPLQQHRTYEFYRSQQNVHKAASSKVSRFGKVSHGQEEISQVSSNTSESQNCHQTVTDSALPTARELPCQDSVPMQTENIWDEGNKENCLDSDQYDSDTTLHSSDTMSDPEIELMATNNDEQQTTRPTRLACAERSSHHGSSPAASELPSQHGYSPAAPELPSQHGYSSDASEHPSQHGYSLAASELPSLHGYSLAASELPSLHGYSLAASELPSLHGYSLAASELPSLHGYSPAASEHPSQHGYSPAAPELPSLHGYSLAASELPSQHGYLPAASELPSQDGYLSAAPELPSQHGYSPAASKLCSHHGYPTPAISSATPMNVKCDLTPPFSENTADAHLLEDANDSGCIDTTTSIQHTPSNCSPALVDIKETFSAATHHATDYSYQAESTEQPTSATIMVCPYGLKYQPQLRLTEVIHDNNGKTCQLDKKSDTPSPSNVQHEDNIQSASSTPPTEVSNHSRGLQSPTFSNSVIVMDAFLPGVTSAAGSRAARDQTKFSAQHWHPAMITHGTDVSRHKPWLPEPQVTTEKVTGNKPTSKICHNIDNASSLQAIYDDMVSSKTNHFQRSLNKSDATLHGSLPDISNAHVGLDPAHSVIFHKDASGQTSNCERIAHRNADKKVSRYTSILLHASSLPNLDQLQSFLLSSSESPEFKLENMQQTITDSRHAPNPQVQGQSTASRCKLIGDIASNLYLAQVTRVQDDEVISSTIKDTLEIHPALPTTHPQLSTESVLNPPPVFPPKNYYFACLDTPATSSLNRKNTDQPEVNSSSKNGSSPESSQEQQIALCHDSSTNTSWSPNGNSENIYTASSPTICCTPTSASRAVVSENSKTDSAFFTVANGGTDQDRSNEQHPPASHPTHSMASKDVKPMKTSGLGVSDLAVGVSNVIQKPKSSKEQPATSAISQNLISIPETPETKNRTETTPQISDCNQTERERQAERLYLEHNVLPIRHMPSYDIAYECDQSKSADTKTIHSTLAKHSSWPLSDLTARTLNNSITTESGNVYSPPTKWNETNNDFKICTTNSEAFVHSDQGKSYSTESFASCYELAQDKSASDTSVPLADKHVSVPVTSDTALFPSRRPLGDHLQAYTTSRKTAPPSSNHKHRSTVLDQDQPAIQATPFGINKENSLEKGDFTMPHEVNTCGTPTGTLRNYQIHPPDFTINASHKAQPHADVPIHLRKAGFFTSSDGLQGGKTLQEYKTKSTLSFTATEDKIEYHELVSIYYSLPLKHSKASSNMVLNHSYHREVPVSTDKNILSPNSILNRKQEFHIDLANTAYQIPRFFGRQLSTDSLSNVTAQQNENDINTTARHTPIRGISWNESEQHTLSPRRRHSTDNISPDLPLQAADLIFPDPIATYSSLHDRYSNALRKNQFQVVSDVADNRRDKTCNYLIPTNHEKREVLYSSPPLNSSSSLLPENDQVFLEHCPRAMNTSSQSQKMDLESRQEILQAKEDYNQNILQVNLTDTIDNSYQNGKTVSTTYDAQINPGEGLFTNGSPIQEKYTSDHTAVTKNRWDSVFLPASKQVILKGPVPEDLYGISSQIPFSLQPGLIDINAITVQHGLQNSKQGQLSPGNQPCTEFSGLQRYARPLGESHKLYSEDEAIGIPRELQTSPTAANPLFVYTTKNRCDKVKSNNEPSSTINWEQIYKTTNRRHSFQDSSRNPPPCKGPLLQRRSDSHVQPNKHKTVSPLSSPLQSLQESVNDNEVPTFSSDDGLTSLQKLNERNEELEASHISMSPVTNSKERTLNSRCTQKGNSYRSSSCTGPDPVQTLNHTKSSFFSKSFPNETARAKHTQRLSSAFESPGEFSVPSPTVSDWLSNQERTIHGHDNPLLPFATDNYNSISHDHFQESVLPEHNSLHEWEIRPWEEDQHVHRSTKSLKNLNLQSRQSGFTDVKVKSDRRFSAITNVDKAYGRYPSSPALSNAIKYTRKSHSHSEVMSFDENDNWHPDSYGTTEYHPTRHFSTSPTVGFGIFGKEQQLAFLENIKRSLTEGRLWRPCFLKNPGFLRREADSTLNNTHFPNPSFDGSTITVQGMPPRETLNIYRDDPVLYSESDTDTTTDDEYYLDDFEKESEL